MSPDTAGLFTHMINPSCFSRMVLGLNPSRYLTVDLTFTAVLSFSRKKLATVSSLHPSRCYNPAKGVAVKLLILLLT